MPHITRHLHMGCGEPLTGSLSWYGEQNTTRHTIDVKTKLVREEKMNNKKGSQRK